MVSLLPEPAPAMTTMGSSGASMTRGLFGGGGQDAELLGQLDRVQHTCPPLSLTGQLDLAAQVRQPSFTLAWKNGPDMPIATVSTRSWAQPGFCVVGQRALRLLQAAFLPAALPTWTSAAPPGSVMPCRRTRRAARRAGRRRAAGGGRARLGRCALPVLRSMITARYGWRVGFQFPAPGITVSREIRPLYKRVAVRLVVREFVVGSFTPFGV